MSQYLVIVNEDVAVTWCHGIVILVSDDHMKNGDACQSRSAGIGDGNRNPILFPLFTVERDECW